MILNFYSTVDKECLSKKKVLLKGIFFYVIAQSLVMFALGVFFIYLKYRNIDIDPFYTKMSKKEISYSWYAIIFIGPFFEELGFRFGLSFKKAHVIIALPILCFILLSAFVGGYVNYVIIKIAICLLVVFILSRTNQLFWTNYSEKHGQKSIIIITFIFAFLHLVNFDISLKYLYIYPLLCLPQIVMGMTFSYLRLNAGFIYALIAHILVNSISIIPELV